MKRLVIAVLMVGCCLTFGQAAPEENAVSADQPKEVSFSTQAGETAELVKALELVTALPVTDGDVCSNFERYQSLKYLQEHADFVSYRRYTDPPNPTFMRAYGVELEELKQSYSKSLALALGTAMKSSKPFDCSFTTKYFLHDGQYSVRGYASDSPGWTSRLISQLKLDNHNLILDDELPNYDEMRTAQIALVKRWVQQWRTEGKESPDWFVQHWANDVVHNYAVKLSEVGLGREEAGVFFFDH